jgi:dTDP-4-dehydrorhamnose reductase
MTVAIFGRAELDLALADMAPLKAFKPAVVINAAAYTQVDKAETDRDMAFAVNAQGPRALAQACDAIAAPLIHVSTDYVFDGRRDGEYVETDAPNPLGVYGASKLAGEVAVQEALGAHVILRTSWVFSEHGANFVKTMLRLAQTRPELRIVGDQRGKPTSAMHLAEAIWAVAGRIAEGAQPWGLYHLTGEPTVTWADFAEAIFDDAPKWLGARPAIHRITTAEYPTAAARPSNSALCTAKFRNTFGFALPPWRDGLRDTLSALRHEYIR